MTSVPISPSMSANFDFLEHYLDSVDHLPLDVQRCISQLREYDLLYRSKLDQIGHLLNRYRNEGPSLDRRKILTKLQKCLIKSQQYGDEKLSIISQMSELVETRTQLVARDAELVDMDCKDEIVQNNVTTSHRMKIEKPHRNIDKSSKSLYDKPKRMRRVRDKFEEKNDKSKIDKDALDDNEEEELIDDEEVEQSRPKKEVKKGKEKDKFKDKGKEDEKIQEKKIEKKSSGKITKKHQNKQSNKLKKKKKKEKELSIEDIPVDPDEPTYCICSSISYGDMIGCDNDECQIEWFHFGCVNLTHKPKGKWYCPQCTIERKERNKK